MQKAHLALFLALIVSFLSAGCSPQESIHELRGEAWGTSYQIKIVATDDDFDEAEIRAVVARTLVDVDDQLSNWNSVSEVSRFNAEMSGDPVNLSSEFNDLMQVAGRVHAASEGYFDLTLAPVIELWGFGSTSGEELQDRTAPADAAIAAAMATIGQDTVLAHDFENAQLRKLNPAASVFLSALAKGAGIDALDEALAGLGLANYLVEVGGDLIAIGPGPRGKGWQIGIEQPTIGTRQASEILGLTDIAMATSGDYRNYFEANGVRFSHIIDPRTGRPITHKAASVTVLSDKAVLADAWATALLAAGEQRGLEIAERENIAALFISRSDTNGSPEFESVSSSEFERVRGKP
ncbi:MAG: FAD:protein FMN transferase [Pseudomonadota bacterium]